MISDIDVRIEQSGIKSFEFVAYMECVFVVHRIDELQDPYCLSNLLVFAQALLGQVEKRPTGKLIAKHWEPFAPTWIAYETDKCYTWHISPGDPEDEMVELSVKTGLPYQSRPETKVNIKVSGQALARAIIVGLGQSNIDTYPANTA